MINDDKLKSFVKKSGFPLQIKVKSIVESDKDLGWNVVTSEHSWSDKDGLRGFLDLVLEHPDYRVIATIECKRVRDSSWIFLREKHASPRRRHFKTWITLGHQLVIDAQGWIEGQVYPETPEAEFCIVGGQDPKSKPMLERTAAELIEATEAFAESYGMYHFAQDETARLFIPVVVTTAELKLCTFDAHEISLATGEIDSAQFETVPFLRFRKQFTDRTIDRNMRSQIDYKVIDRQKENSIFVVNSEHVLDFLSELSVHDFDLPHT